MKKKLRQYREFLRSSRGILGENPVVVYGLALPLMIMGTTSLKNAVAISFGILLTTVPVLALAALVGDRLALHLRIPIYALAASVLLYFGSFAVGRLAPNIFDSLGIYYPLTAINSILFTLVQTMPADEKPHTAALAGLRNAVGFTLAACAMAVLRELLGSGTLWGRAVPFATVKASGVLLPFFGFILLGLFSAGMRHLNRLIKASLLREDGKKTAVRS